MICRERHNHPVHEQVDYDPIQHAGKNRSPSQENELPTSPIKYAGRRKRDQEMKRGSKQRGLPTTIKRFRTKQSAGDSAQNLHGPDSPRCPGDKGGSDIQDTSCNTSREDGKKCARPSRRYRRWCAQGGDRYGSRQNYLALVSAALRTSNIGTMLNRLTSLIMRSVSILCSGLPAGIESGNSVFSGKNLRGTGPRFGFRPVSSGR